MTGIELRPIEIQRYAWIFVIPAQAKIPKRQRCGMIRTTGVYEFPPSRT
ncbi:hypothetical protein [uncultured Sphingomonas sp.]|nr:hypothetical protein [uncultured Sphingomonas sp.]